MISSLGIKNIRRPKKIKKERSNITEVIIKDMYSIIKEFENLPYEGYVRKRSKHIPNNGYFITSKKS